uniref:Uncharacterized protein n=1 Tax=viral metagenome TaxID=1070528 RepID=A0A6C0BPG8_9ZZZZ
MSTWSSKKKNQKSGTKNFLPIFFRLSEFFFEVHFFSKWGFLEIFFRKLKN